VAELGSGTVRARRGPQRRVETAPDPARAERDELIFTSPDGHKLRSPNFLRRVWRPAVADCDLGDLVPHDLRHTAASLSISAGASAKAVQRMLGHASAQIALDRYTHLYDDDLEDLADSMDARYGAAQVRPKPEPGEVFHMAKGRHKAKT